MFNRFKNIIFKIKYYVYLKKVLLKNKKNIFLLGTPWYGNLGDHAITLGEHYVLKKCFPEHILIDIPYNLYNIKWMNFFHITIPKTDILFLQGGGNLGSLYPWEEQFHRNIVAKYINNKIIVMPVSIFFQNNDFGKDQLRKSIDVYNKHPNLTIISRDENSYSFAKKYFNKVNNILAPDIVTSLDGILGEDINKRRGVQFFLRRDIEKILSDDIIEKIKGYLNNNNIYFNISDTTVPYEVREDTRKKEVFDKLNMAHNAKLVITDRYHGLIFSVITHTPVIVFKSFDTKISSGIKWFNDLPWVHYINSNNVKEVFSLINQYCKNEIYNSSKRTNCKDIILKTMERIKNERNK